MSFMILERFKLKILGNDNNLMIISEDFYLKFILQNCIILWELDLVKEPVQNP